MIIPSASRLSRVEEYYFSKKLAEVRGLINSGKPILNLAIGNPDLMPSENSIETLKSVAEQQNVHGYQPYRGMAEWRSAIENYYKRIYNVSLNSETQILPLMGSKEGIFHISMAFLNDGDRVLVPDPGYLAYTATARLAGAEPIFYSLNAEKKWFPDLEALQKLDLTNVKLMWINYPHMPTGATASVADFQKIVDFAKTNSILLCHDNPYSRILNDYPQSVLAAKDAFKCAIELNSLSKSHNMAGWRVGYVCGEADYLNAILKVKSNIDSGQFYPLQAAAIDALNNSDEWHNEQNEIYKKRRKCVYRFLDVLNCSYAIDTVGMFIWAKIPDSTITSMDFVDKLLYSKDIFITPGNIFGENGEGYVRVSLCAPEAKFEEALSRLE